MEKRILIDTVSVHLKNGRTVIGYWRFQYNYIFVNCNDAEFFGSYSIESSYYSAECDARWCLRKIIQSKNEK